jgi:hypothetical protein
MIGIPDDLIRHRSYEIWLRDGCPHGLAVQHWFEAKAELEAELCAVQLVSPDFDCCMIVLPRPKISRFPQRRIAARIADRSAA